MKAVVSISASFRLKSDFLFKYWIFHGKQALLSLVVATAMAKPQYGQQAAAPAPAWPAQQSPAPAWPAQQSSPAPQWPAQQPAAAPAVTAEQWASLNPYGSNSAAYPAEERPQIEEIQRQWARFLEYLPWLKVSQCDFLINLSCGFTFTLFRITGTTGSSWPTWTPRCCWCRWCRRSFWR